MCGDDDGDDDEKKKKEEEEEEEEDEEEDEDEDEDEEEEEEEERAFHIMSPVVIRTAVGDHGASSCWRGHLSYLALRSAGASTHKYANTPTLEQNNQSNLVVEMYQTCKTLVARRKRKFSSIENENLLLPSSNVYDTSGP